MTRPATTPSLRRALRREVPSTVGLLADAHDFTAMRRYATFPFDDHPVYLRQVEALLKTLSTQGGHTTVTLFDPEEYAQYCEDTGIDPDHPASRSRYTAELAAEGPRVTYTGQPMTDLVPTLVDTAARRATREYATTLLTDTGDCAACGQDIGRAAFDQASRLLMRLLDAAGPGTHHLVCSVPAADEQLLAALQTTRDDERPLTLDPDRGAEFVTVLAVGIALESPGGVVLRTMNPGARDRLHGWRLTRGDLIPLTEAEVFSAYCTDAHTGEPLSPEPHVEYRAGFALAPEDNDWPTHP
ncbi:hypothetical protein [Streptomyces lateritius]|uniref:hypothetical protein n=1 Tax=Streptomyces lateritius TaxID=67313 RepID=UPI001672CEEA|nr:hypothetical protein [Streptomyces lateritius]GGT77999.1 hypothetical protein GCM10010272_22270 [Streptomyces lateritius]